MQTKKYRLKKDLPDAKAGAIFNFDGDDSYEYQSIQYSDGISWFKNVVVENNPDWFELVEDVPENNLRQTYLKDCHCNNGGIILHSGKAVCRWCRKPYAKGSCINYLPEHFNVEDKKPLFVTEDGVKIFEGDDFICVDGVWGMFDRYEASESQFEDLKSHCKFFSNEEKAEEYILMNKPCLSIQDVMNRLNGYFMKENVVLAFKNLKQFIQCKSN